ncbi:MAG: hypothetical protein ACM3YE_10495 [Bacteroidota bacterium]
MMLAFALVVVPRQEIRKWFWFSLLWGSTIDGSLIILFRILNLYYYDKLEPFNFLGAPMWIPLAWSPAIILLVYFYPNRKEWYYRAFYIAAYSMMGVGVGLFFKQAGLIKEIHWNEFLRFPVHMIWFYGAVRHYQYLQSTETKQKNQHPINNG